MPQDPVNNPPHNPQHGILQNGAAQTPAQQSPAQPENPVVPQPSWPAYAQPGQQPSQFQPAPRNFPWRLLGAAAGWGRRRDSGPHQAL